MSTEQYQVLAYNYAHDSENKIHDDQTAARYGFKGGLVPGVADFAYLSRAVFQTWGDAWLRGGSMHAKFIKPVYHGELARAIASPASRDNGAAQLSLALLNPAGVQCAIGSALLQHGRSAPMIDDFPVCEPLVPESLPSPTLASFAVGRVLSAIEYVHQEQQAQDLAKSLFVEAMPAQGESVIWHPALCLYYANQIVKKNVRLGAWVHTASHVDYFDSPAEGESVALHGKVADVYLKRGHVVADLQLAMFADGQRPLVSILHSAIISLAQP